MKLDNLFSIIESPEYESRFAIISSVKYMYKLIQESEEFIILENFPDKEFLAEKLQERIELLIENNIDLIYRIYNETALIVYIINLWSVDKERYCLITSLVNEVPNSWYLRGLVRSL